MSHELTKRNDGTAEMAYTGRTPWHGLGQVLPPGGDLETWRTAAGLDWSVEAAPATYQVGDDQLTVPDRQVLYRSDNHQALGVVSNRYKVVQPAEALEFFRDLVEAEGYTLETAGSLFQGRRYWALAALGESAVVVGDDRVDGYLLLSTSCDGTLTTTARLTAVRVVCHNTLSAAINRRSKAQVNTPHSTKFDANLVKDQLGLARGSFAEFLKQARQLAKTPVSRNRAAELVADLLVDTKMVFSQEPTEAKPHQEIMRLFDGQAIGAEQYDTGNLWSLVNSVTEFVDHKARAQTDSNRLNSAWFGRGDRLKTEALQRALAV